MRFHLSALHLTHLLFDPRRRAGLYMWPSVIHHTADLSITHGIQFSLLAGLGLTAVLWAARW
jgi:hypothetical protein